MTDTPRYLIFFFPCVLAAQFHLNSVTTTNTQAIVSYNPGTSLACTINVTDSTGATVNDVNASLGGDFAGANADTRFASGAVGNSRTFTVGQKDITGIGSDGNKRNRALQALSQYTGQFTCNGFTAPTFTFTTQNVPVGNTHNNGVPVDRAHPGQYALENMRWGTQSQIFIDPDTGIAATRATAPSDAVTASQAFITAVAGAGWTGSPIGGTATFSGTGTAADAMFLRADNLVLNGGGTYTSDGGVSFDSFTLTVNNASASSGNLGACITINGATCIGAQLTRALSSTPTAYTFPSTGAGTLMSLWQASGPPLFGTPDVSLRSGTASIAAGVVTWVSGNKFNIHWIAGSTITVAATQYTIASVQSENQITLTTTPTVATTTYSAPNFGVLVWCTASCTVGNTVYGYTSAAMPTWPTFGFYTSSPVYTVGGQSFYYTFFGSELFKCVIGLPCADEGYVLNSGGLGPSTGFVPGGQGWDLVIPGAFYALVEYFGGGVHILQYLLGNQSQAGVPNAQVPTCPASGAFCVGYNTMTNDVYTDAVALNPNCANFAYTPGSAYILGSLGGSYFGFSISTQQDYFGCLVVYGETAGSFAIVAATDTWSKAPFSWCNIHDPFTPSGSSVGWTGFGANNNGSPTQQYSTTLTSSGQLNLPLVACPVGNPFGVTGNNCSVIAITGQPVNSLAATLQNIQVGDVAEIQGEETEAFRVLQVTPTYIVQRAYLGTAVNHTNTTLVMECGCLVQGALANAIQGGSGLWNFRADPTGTNPSYLTKLPAFYSPGSHGNAGLVTSPPQPYTLQAGGSNLPNATLCPTSAGYCDEIWPGDYATAFLANIPAPNAISISPPFAGIMPAISQPNSVDTHAGPGFLGWVMDARPYNGGGNNVCSGANPFVNVTGFLWKCAAANVSINRRLVTTVAYVGRSSFVDVSGPGCSIGGTSADNYKYGVVLIAGECFAGSSVGDLFANAPYVSLPYCNENPANGSQGDDNNYLCFGDLGAYAGHIAQMGWTTNDLFGTTSRPLGGVHNIWNSQDGFWNANNVLNGTLSGNYMRWGDGVRSEVITATLPPFPAPDAVNRSTFVPVKVTMNPPLGVTGETVNFWYSELGIGCTSRQDNCVASAATIGSTPYQWASEAITPLACTSNCLIAIPALSGRVVNWQPVYWAGGVKIFTGPVQQITTP